MVMSSVRQPSNSHKYEPIKMHVGFSLSLHKKLFIVDICLALVVQRLDIPINLMNLYPVDSVVHFAITNQLDSDLSFG